MDNNTDNNKNNLAIDIPQGGLSSPEQFLWRKKNRKTWIKSLEQGWESNLSHISGRRAFSPLLYSHSPLSLPRSKWIKNDVMIFWNDYLSVFEKRKPKLWQQPIRMQSIKWQDAISVGWLTRVIDTSDWLFCTWLFHAVYEFSGPITKRLVY